MNGCFVMDLTCKRLSNLRHCLAQNARTAYLGASLAIHWLSFLLLTPEIPDLKARVSYLNINAVFRSAAVPALMALETGESPNLSSSGLTRESGKVAPGRGPQVKPEDDKEGRVAVNTNDAEDIKIVGNTPIKARKPRLLNGDSIKIDYPARARLYKIEGSVRLKLIIAENGIVKKAEVMSGPAFGLKEAALNLAKKLLFLPATDQDGNETVAEVEHEVIFKLKKAS